MVTGYSMTAHLASVAYDLGYHTSLVATYTLSMVVFFNFLNVLNLLHDPSTVLAYVSLPLR